MRTTPRARRALAPYSCLWIAAAVRPVLLDFVVSLQVYAPCDGGDWCASVNSACVRPCLVARPSSASAAVARDLSSSFWRKAAARLAARVNLAIWLERFGPLFFGWSTAVAVAIYALRRAEGPVGFAWIALLAGSLIAAAIAGWLGRGKFHAPADARVLLESSLRLDARLSAAEDGVAKWPEPRADLPVIVRWRSLAAPGWLGGATALLAAATLLPLASGSASGRQAVEKPPALAQTEAMLQELARLELADPASIEQLAAQARELSDRPLEEQYTHSSLEAADVLRDQTMAGVQNLARGYEGAAAALGERDGVDGETGASELGVALDGLRTGRLAGNKSLTSALGRQTNLTPEQLEQLRDRLKEAAGQARGVAGAAGAGAEVAQPGEELVDGPPGSGAVTRGRADAPLTMTLDAAPANEGRMQAVENLDLARAQLGDFAGLEHGGGHHVDPTKAAGPGAGGGAAAAGRGSDAVWVDRLSPADRAALREIFK